MSEPYRCQHLAFVPYRENDTRIVTVYGVEAGRINREWLRRMESQKPTDFRWRPIGRGGRPAPYNVPQRYGYPGGSCDPTQCCYEDDPLDYFVSISETEPPEPGGYIWWHTKNEHIISLLCPEHNNEMLLRILNRIEAL